MRVRRKAKRTVMAMAASVRMQVLTMERYWSFLLPQLMQKMAMPWTRYMLQDILERKLKRRVSRRVRKKEPWTPSREGPTIKVVAKGQRMRPKLMHIEWNHCGQSLPVCSIRGKNVTKLSMNIPNHSTATRKTLLSSSFYFIICTFTPTLALRNPCFSAGLVCLRGRKSRQAMAKKRPQRQGVQRQQGLMQTSKMQSLKVQRASRVMGYFCSCCSVQMRLMVQEKAISAAASRKDPILVLEQSSSSRRLSRKSCISICRQKPQGMHRVLPLLTRLSTNSSDRHMFLQMLMYSSLSTHFGPLPRCRNTEQQKPSVNRQVGIILSSFLPRAMGYLAGELRSVNLQARKKPLRKRKMSVARSVVWTSKAKGRQRTKLRVMTLTAPMRLLKKVSPMTIHMMVRARTPLSTDKSLGLCLSTSAIFYCKRNDCSHPSHLRLSEATATTRTSPTSTNIVRQNTQLYSNRMFWGSVTTFQTAMGAPESRKAVVSTQVTSWCEH